MGGFGKTMIGEQRFFSSRLHEPPRSVGRSFGRWDEVHAKNYLAFKLELSQFSLRGLNGDDRWVSHFTSLAALKTQSPFRPGTNDDRRRLRPSKGGKSGFFFLLFFQNWHYLTCHSATCRSLAFLVMLYCVITTSSYEIYNPLSRQRS